MNTFCTWMAHAEFSCAGPEEHRKLDAHLLGKDDDPQHWKFVVTLPEDGSSEVLSRLQDKGALQSAYRPPLL